MPNECLNDTYTSSGTKGNGVCSPTSIFIALKRKITHLSQVAHIYLSPLSPLNLFKNKRKTIYDIFGMFSSPTTISTKLQFS